MRTIVVDTRHCAVWASISVAHPGEWCWSAGGAGSGYAMTEADAVAACEATRGWAGPDLAAPLPGESASLRNGRERARVLGQTG